jgi:hypothetical protein
LKKPSSFVAYFLISNLINRFIWSHEVCREKNFAFFFVFPDTALFLGRQSCKEAPIKSWLIFYPGFYYELADWDRVEAEIWFLFVIVFICRFFERWPIKKSYYSVKCDKIGYQ